jgi:hypothetical protein
MGRKPGFVAEMAAMSDTPPTLVVSRQRGTPVCSPCEKLQMLKMLQLQLREICNNDGWR